MENLNEKEITGYFNPKSYYALVERPLLRRLICKEEYKKFDIVFEQGKQYVVWIARCYHNKSARNEFFFMVAIAGEKAGFYIVPLTTFGEYEKGEIDLVVDLHGEEYKLIREFDGNHKLIPRWQQYRDKMHAYVEREDVLGAGEYVICARIFGHKDDANISFVGWEILQKKKPYNQVSIFNLFTGEFVKQAADYSDIYPLGNNQKAVKRSGMEIKYSDKKLRILLNPEKKKKAPRVPKTQKY